jgi:hypothetical protein
MACDVMLDDDCDDFRCVMIGLRLLAAVLASTVRFPADLGLTSSGDSTDFPITVPPSGARTPVLDPRPFPPSAPRGWSVDDD